MAILIKSGRGCSCRRGRKREQKEKKKQKLYFQCKHSVSLERTAKSLGTTEQGLKVLRCVKRMKY